MSNVRSEYAALEAEHETLLGFLYLCPVGLIQSDIDGCVRMINPHAAQLLMPLVRVPSIANIFSALEGCCPELRNLVSGFGAASGQICEGHRIVIGVSTPGPRVLSCSVLKINATSVVTVLQDITREVEQERKIRQSNAMFTALLASVSDFALFSLGADGLIDNWNPSSSRLTGFLATEVMGHGIEALCHPDDDQSAEAAEQLRTVAREGWALREAKFRGRDGSDFWCQILIAAVEGAGGDIESYSVVVRDVADRRMTGDDLHRLLTTDHLTGAANRARFFELAEIERVRLTRTGCPLSTIIFDVDHFKHVNDTFGHAAGDALLVALVRVCRTCLSDRTTLARIGGEEFAVLLPDTALADAVGIAESMRRAVAVDLAKVDGLAIGATISLGCAEMTDGQLGIDDVLAAADQAMYRAKRAGRNQVVSAMPVTRSPADSPANAHV